MIMTYQHRCERVDPFVKGGVILADIPHIRLRVSKEPAILHDGDYPIGLTKPSLGAVN